MARFITPFTLALVLLLAACAGQEQHAAPVATLDDVAREFVTALGSWDEPTVRRLIIPNATTEIMIASEGNDWRGWARYPLGPQTSVEITESTVEENRATVVVRSLHEKGESGVRLSMLQVDGAWRVESWHSYLP